jgi:hypothetical protein
MKVMSSMNNSVKIPTSLTPSSAAVAFQDYGKAAREQNKEQADRDEGQRRLIPEVKLAAEQFKNSPIANTSFPSIQAANIEYNKLIRAEGSALIGNNLNLYAVEMPDGKVKVVAMSAIPRVKGRSQTSTIDTQTQGEDATDADSVFINRQIKQLESQGFKNPGGNSIYKLVCLRGGLSSKAYDEAEQHAISIDGYGGVHHKHFLKMYNKKE